MTGQDGLMASANVVAVKQERAFDLEAGFYNSIIDTGWTEKSIEEHDKCSDPQGSGVHGGDSPETPKEVEERKYIRGELARLRNEAKTRKRRGRAYSAIMTGLQTKGDFRLVTLTTGHIMPCGACGADCDLCREGWLAEGECSLFGEVRRPNVHHAWRLFRLRMKRKGIDFDYFAVREKSKFSGLLHLHVIFKRTKGRMNRGMIKLIREVWSVVTGSRWIYANRIRRRKLANYLIKYIVKDTDTFRYLYSQGWISPYWRSFSREFYLINGYQVDPAYYDMRYDNKKVAKEIIEDLLTEDWATATSNGFYIRYRSKFPSLNYLMKRPSFGVYEVDVKQILFNALIRFDRLYEAKHYPFTDYYERYLQGLKERKEKGVLAYDMG